jgi:hypothetical protein
VYHLCISQCTTLILGNTSAGGTNNAGTIYSIFSPNLTTGRVFTEQIELSYTPLETGSNPTGRVIAHSYYGPYFGVASRGGTHGKGTVVELKGLGGANAMLSFDGRDGALPAGGLSSLPRRTYLAATYSGGGHHLGAIVSITATHWKKLRAKVLYSFGRTSGAHPNSELTDGDVSGVPHCGTTAASKGVPIQLRPHYSERHSTAARRDTARFMN